MTKAKSVKSTIETNGLPRSSLGVEGNGRGSPPFSPNESPQFSSQPTQPHRQPTEETIQLLTLNENEFRDLLRNLAASCGCAAELARRAGVTGQFIGDVIAGRKSAGPKLLSALGDLGVEVTVETVFKVRMSMEGE